MEDMFITWSSISRPSRSFIITIMSVVGLITILVSEHHLFLYYYNSHKLMYISEEDRHSPGLVERVKNMFGYDHSCSCLMDQYCFNPNSSYYHIYNAEEADKCLSIISNKTGSRVPFIFVGDSRSRIIYHHFEELLGGESEKFEEIRYLRMCHKRGRGSSYRFNASNYLIKFVWRSFANEELVTFIRNLKGTCENERSECPSYLFTDVYAHDANPCFKSIYNDTFSRYINGISKYIKELETLSSTPVSVVYKRTDPYYHFMGAVNNPTEADTVLWMESVRTIVKEAPFIKFWDSNVPLHLKARQICWELYLKKKANKSNCGDGCHAPQYTYGEEMQIMLNFMCNRVIYSEKQLYCSENTDTKKLSGKK